MNKLLQLLKWDAILLHRNRLFIIAGAVAVLYIGIFYLLKPLGSLDRILAVLVFNDPVVTGFIFAGILWMFDKNQNTLQALNVTPIKLTTYLFSKITILSLLGTMSAVLMALAAMGTAVNYFHLILSTYFSSFIFSCVGFMVGATSSNFNNFLMRSIGVFVLMAVPMLWIFDIGNFWWYLIVPITGGVGTLYAAVSEVEPVIIFASYLQLGAVSYISWLLVKRITAKQLL